MIHIHMLDWRIPDSLMRNMVNGDTARDWTTSKSTDMHIDSCSRCVNSTPEQLANMLIDISPQDLFNSDLSLKVNDSPCLVLFTEVGCVDSPCCMMSKRDAMRNVEAYAAVRKSASASRYNIYAVTIVSGSATDQYIRSGRSMLASFTSYPQLVAYVNGRPTVYANGNITDKTTVAVGFNTLSYLLATASTGTVKTEEEIVETRVVRESPDAIPEELGTALYRTRNGRVIY